jgi:hypothetical protein
MNNETNLNSQVSDVLLDRRSFGGTSRPLPIVAAAFASNDYWLITGTTGNASLATAPALVTGRVGQSLTFHTTDATSLSATSVPGGCAFANVGDELTCEYEIAFDTGFHDDLGFFYGVGSTLAPVLADSIAIADTVGVQKLVAGTGLDFITRTASGTVTRTAIPGVTFAAGTRYLIRFTVRKTATTTTSADYRVEVIENALANGGTVGGTGKTYRLEGSTTTLPATTTLLVNTQAYLGNTTDSIKFTVFGDACRFVTKV